MNNLQHDNWDKHLVELAHDAAKHLVGTCKTLADLGEEFENVENETAFCTTLDSLIFCCDCCGWWCDVDELKNETEQELCEDCNDNL